MKFLKAVGFVFLTGIFGGQSAFAVQNHGVYTAVSNNRWLVTNGTLAQADLFYAALDSGSNVMKLDLAFDVQNTTDFIFSGTMGRTKDGGNGLSYKNVVGGGYYSGNFQAYIFSFSDGLGTQWLCTFDQNVNGTCSLYSPNTGRNLGKVNFTWLP